MGKWLAGSGYTIKKKSIVIYGNCQGEVLALHLREDPAVAGIYDILYVPNFKHPILSQSLDESQIKNCQYYLWQTSRRLLKPDFHDRIPSEAHTIRFPVLWMKILWPLTAKDPRNRPEPGFPFGRYPYGDRIVLDLLQKNLSPDDIYHAYWDVDLSKVVDLDRNYEICIEKLEQVDTLSDIRFADYVKAHFRNRKLFSSLNHPRQFILRMLSTPIRGYIAYGDTTLRVTEGPDNGQLIGTMEIPVHPAVIRHYGIEWASAESKYTYGGALLSFDEYLKNYIRFA